jgi:hypothetical protein
LRSLARRDYLKDLGTDGRIILKWILEKYCSGVWIHLAQDKDQWWAIVDIVMTL